MSLVPCRACGHQVDTSALVCPGCGATDPANKMSRQQRNAMLFVVLLIFWLGVLGFGGWYVVHTVVPVVKQYFFKPQTDQSPVARP